MPQQTTTIKIIITDDHALYRSGMKTALAPYKDIEVIAEAGNGQELLDKLTYLRPDVVVTGFNMPVMNGMEALVQIRQLYPGLKVIMISMVDDASYIRQAVENGVNAYLSKTASTEEIYEAIATCCQQWFYFNLTVARAFVNYKHELKKEGQYLMFNTTELLVLQMLYDGKPISNIADTADLSERTIKAVIERMKAKTNTPTVAGLLFYAMKEKIIE